jgi:exopolyphosphatase/guanosine-5'-triphosphate,3'-diphosphate pyrophosphatase
VPIAVIDIGTNSTRLLIARVEDGSVEQLDRRSTVTRLGQGVDSSGRLAGEAMQRVHDVLAEYKEAIDSSGAEPVVGLATSAVRDSENGDDFRADVLERFGFDLRTLTGDEEARLTFLGATAAREADEEPTLVIDIGGGSTELVIGRPGGATEPDFHVSTQAGSVRQTERHLHDDPPSAAQLDALRDDVRSIVEDGAPAGIRRGVTRAIAVAGTATQLARVDLRGEVDDGVHGHVLELASIREILARLASVPLEERRRAPGLDPKRAPTIVAGAAILVEVLSAFGLERVEASETDILHGAALLAADARNG